MTIEAKYDALLGGKICCPKCVQPVTLAGVTQTLDIATFGSPTAKLRVIVCERCGTESHYQSER